jgi:hypothetical protein
MALIGYARVSTENQITDRQLDELRAAGCAEMFEKHASGGDRDHPVLAKRSRASKPATPGRALARGSVSIHAIRDERYRAAEA